MRGVLLICLFFIMQSSAAYAQNYNFGCATLTHSGDNDEVTTVDSYDEPSVGCNGDAPNGAPAPNSTAAEDDTYENLCLRQNEVQGARPQVCQVHRRMPATWDTIIDEFEIAHTISPLNLSPWYMISMQDPAKPYHPYLGPLYRGESNYARYNMRLSQTDPTDTVLGCIPQIRPISGGPNPYDPFWMRAEMDNCANQYILSRARFARFANEIQRDGDNRGDKPLPVAADQANNLCQPLRLIPLSSGEQEFSPTDYVWHAWKKLLFNAGSTMRSGAEYEPLYERIGVTISNGTDGYADNRISPPTKDRVPFRCSNASKKSFGSVCLNGITASQVERIIDPSHPFSPRWDTRGNERDTYSPWTIIYTQDPLTILYGVRCAGDNGARYYKVDMMPWRYNKFLRGIMRRILWNILCRYITVTFYDIVTWNCWDGSIEILEVEVIDGVPWNCEENTEGGDSGDNDYGQCCATNWGGEDVEIFGLRNIFCGTGSKSIINLCKALAKSIPTINPLKIRATDAYNFPLGVPEGYKFTDYFGFHRPYLRCWDTGLECSTGDPIDDPDLLSAEGARVAIIGAGREGQSCTLGGGYGASSGLTSVAFPGLYDNNWLNKIEAMLASFGNMQDAFEGLSGMGDVSFDMDSATLEEALSATTDLLGNAFEIVEMEDRQDNAEPITSWSELKQYQMRATRDFGLNCLAKNEQVFKQGTGEDMILGFAGGQYQRLVPDNADNGALSYTRYHTIAWPKGWRGYVTDTSVSRRFPNFGSDYGGFDINGQLSNLAELIGAEFIGDFDTESIADGLYEDGMDNAKRGDVLVFDQDVVMTGPSQSGYDYPVGSAASWRLPFVAYVTDTNLVSATSGGIDPTSQLATLVTPNIDKQWVSVLAFNHGKFPDACGNTDAWGEGQEFKMFDPRNDGVPTVAQSDLPVQSGYALLDFAAQFPESSPVAPSWTITCRDPRNSQCVEESWTSVKRYSFREDQRGLSLAGGLEAAMDLYNEYGADMFDEEHQEENQNATAAGD